MIRPRPSGSRQPRARRTRARRSWTPGGRKCAASVAMSPRERRTILRPGTPAVLRGRGGLESRGSGTVQTKVVACSYGVSMRKRLIKTGNSLALVLDRPFLAAANIDARTPLEVSSDGDVIVIAPLRGRRRSALIKAAAEEINREFAGVF